MLMLAPRTRPQHESLLFSKSTSMCFSNTGNSQTSFYPFQKITRGKTHNCCRRAELQRYHESQQRFTPTPKSRPELVSSAPLVHPPSSLFLADSRSVRLRLNRSADGPDFRDVPKRSSSHHPESNSERESCGSASSSSSSPVRKETKWSSQGKSPRLSHLEI